ncbi:hypothetical protein MW887_011832 [Aspergillus wentii]|nr:hypothetical protein MW887_011832 [Aspergillus wentii]
MQISSSWVLQGQNGIESLKVVDKEIPRPGDHEVLVRIYAASLNHRELAIAKGDHSLIIKDKVVPGSDGAGVVQSVGSKVTSFQPGDEVCTHLVSEYPESEPVSLREITTGLGQHLDGTLRPYGVFHESGLVKMPSGLSFIEASTLTCAGLTAWNALFGLEGRGPKKGDTDLVQGTGGVSVIALQFALACGATIIATTSSDSKAQKLQSLGAHHVLNYRTNPNWGETAKTLTPGQKGCDLVVDVGGLSTLNQSFKAVRSDGVISITGVLGSAPDSEVPGLMHTLFNPCTARGVALGTRRQFKEMNRFVHQQQIRPVVDERVFGYEEVKEAYEYMMAQKHFSKVCVRIEEGSGN